MVISGPTWWSALKSAPTRSAGGAAREASERLTATSSTARTGRQPTNERKVSSPDRAPGQQVSEYIRRIFQDKAGNIWFGTNNDGVCRYDGKSFAYFTMKEGFSGRGVRGIVQDESGNLWFATEDGVYRYDGKSFTPFPIPAAGDKSNSRFDPNLVWSILEDKAGNL